MGTDPGLTLWICWKWSNLSGHEGQGRHIMSILDRLGYDRGKCLKILCTIGMDGDGLHTTRRWKGEGSYKKRTIVYIGLMSSSKMKQTFVAYRLMHAMQSRMHILLNTWSGYYNLFIVEVNIIDNYSKTTNITTTYWLLCPHK